LEQNLHIIVSKSGFIQVLNPVLVLRIKIKKKMLKKSLLK